MKNEMKERWRVRRKNNIFFKSKPQKHIERKMLLNTTYKATFSPYFTRPLQTSKTGIVLATRGLLYYACLMRESPIAYE